MNWNTILNQTKPLFMRLTRMKFIDPRESKSTTNQTFATYCEEVIAAFRNLQDK